MAASESARSGAKSSRAKTEKAPPAAAPEKPRVILLTGSESGNKAAEARRLLESAVDPDFLDFDAELLDGAATGADRVLSAVQQAPMGNGRRVVLVKDPQQMDAEDQRRIAAAVERLPSSALLILQTGSPAYDEGRVRRQSVVAPEVTAAVKKWGRTMDFAVPRADDVRAWVQNEARVLGKTLTGEALGLLAQLPGEDLQRLRSEMEKAAAHAGPNNTVISGADVEATLSRSPDDVIFKLCDSVGSRRVPEALGHISTLFRGGGRPDAIAPRTLVLLARQFRLLAQFHFLAEQRINGSQGLSADVAALLPSDGAASILANPRMRWMADKYFGQARRFSGAELAQRLELLFKADLQLKGMEPGGESPKATLQKLVAELC